MNVYIGTTVRSMETLVQGDWSQHSNYTVVVCSQVRACGPVAPRRRMRAC